MRYDLKVEFKRQSADEYYAKLKEKKALIDMKEIKLKRNLDQNGLYWLWLACIQQETGMYKDELHVLYRAKFLRRPDEYVEKIIKPKVWNRIKEISEQFLFKTEIREIIDLISYSTTELDVSEFAKFTNKIKDHAKNNFGVILLTLKDSQFEPFHKEYHRYE